MSDRHFSSDEAQGTAICKAWTEAVPPPQEILKFVVNPGDTVTVRLDHDRRHDYQEPAPKRQLRP